MFYAKKNNKGEHLFNLLIKIPSELYINFDSFRFYEPWST